MESEAKQIQEDEGVVKSSLSGGHVSYEDHLGIPTGGVGHRLTSEEKSLYPKGVEIPQEVVEAWFEEDMKEAADDAMSLLKGVAVPDEVQSIITNMSFNMGRTRLAEFKEMFKALRDGDWQEAAVQMKDSRWFEQTGDRSKRLVARMAGVK